MNKEKYLQADRSNNYLNTEKLQSMFPNVKNIKDSIRDILQEYKKTYNPSLNNKDTIKCLFITGGCGFIGSNFINYFCKKFPLIKVINFDTLYYCAKKENVDKSIRESKNYTFIEGNLRSFGTFKTYFSNKLH